MTVSAETEWAQNGTLFSPRTRADKTKLIPAGVYNFGQTPDGAWFLNRTYDKFEFPFKVYGSCDAIIQRIVTYWTANGGTLGVLMNGLRGAGKTMAAQQLANLLIEKRKLPVLAVRGPIPLQAIFDYVRQDLMVIFDEFEKTHDKDQQQHLLSTIDGMGRSAHARLILFTTNNPTIDENFRDRPSRIHYQFDFHRVSDELIDGLITDGLPKDLMHLKPEILDFLGSRSICTIDIVKAVIAEVRTFRESPANFEGLLNISKGEPPSYTVAMLDEEGKPFNTVCHLFRPDAPGHNATLACGKRALEDFNERRNRPSFSGLVMRYDATDGAFQVNLLEKLKEPYQWLAEIAIPAARSFYGKFDFLDPYGVSLWLDNKPENWSFPYNYETSKDKEAVKALEVLYNRSSGKRTLFGTDKRAVFRVSIAPNKPQASSTQWKVTGSAASSWD